MEANLGPKCTTKVQHFAWRLCHNSLATGDILKKKNIQVRSTAKTVVGTQKLPFIYSCNVNFSKEIWEEAGFVKGLARCKASSWLLFLHELQDCQAVYL